MTIQQELNDFLADVIATRGLQFDEDGIRHTHNKADPSAPVPPFKFNLCTPALRQEGRLSDADMDRMAGFIGHGLLKTRPLPGAIAGIPNVGADIAQRVEMYLRREGCYLPRLRLAKREPGFDIVDNANYKSGPVCIIDDLIHRGLSKRRFMAALEAAGYTVTDCWVFLTYEQGGEEYFDKLGTAVHAVSTVRSTLWLGHDVGHITHYQYRLAMQYLEGTRTAVI
jgi:orotate phosphoribosyltransferase